MICSPNDMASRSSLQLTTWTWWRKRRVWRRAVNCTRSSLGERKETSHARSHCYPHVGFLHSGTHPRSETGSPQHYTVRSLLVRCFVCRRCWQAPTRWICRLYPFSSCTLQMPGSATWRGYAYLPYHYRWFSRLHCHPHQQQNPLPLKHTWNPKTCHYLPWLQSPQLHQHSIEIVCEDIKERMNKHICPCALFLV